MTHNKSFGLTARDCRVISKPLPVRFEYDPETPGFIKIFFDQAAPNTPPLFLKLFFVETLTIASTDGKPIPLGNNWQAVHTADSRVNFTNTADPHQLTFSVSLKVLQSLENTCREHGLIA